MARSKPETDIHDHTADEPAPAAPAVPLNPDERARLEELRAKSAILARKLSDDEQRQLEELEHRAAPQSADAANRLQRGLAPDMPVQTPRPLPAEDANRLRDLRVAHSFGRLNSDEKSEMDDLGRREAELAGHVVAEPDPRAEDHGYWVVSEIVGIIEGIVDQVPALHGLRPRLTRLTARLRDLRAEPVEPPRA